MERMETGHTVTLCKYCLIDHIRVSQIQWDLWRLVVFFDHEEKLTQNYYFYLKGNQSAVLSGRQIT